MKMVSYNIPQSVVLVQVEGDQLLSGDARIPPVVADPPPAPFAGADHFRGNVTAHVARGRNDR